MKRLDFFSRPFYEYHLPRVCVRLFWRGYSVPQRPYFSRQYTLASFGAGPFGVMLMRYHIPRRAPGETP